MPRLYDPTTATAIREWLCAQFGAGASSWGFIRMMHSHGSVYYLGFRRPEHAFHFAMMWKGATPE